MSNIGTFLQGICSLLNKKAILKKCYRTCAVFTAGVAVVAVISLTDKNFGGGGKNSVDVNSEKSQELQEDLEDAGEAQTAMLLTPGEVFTDQEGLSLADSLSVPEEELALEEEQENVPKTPTCVESNHAETVTQENAFDVISITEKEYDILLRIVEAEATDEDVKGKMLVANVVLNRVESTRFPNDIESVVFQRNGSKYQFSPLKDGRYYEVEITENTRLAVDRVLNGEDESMGALFFVCRELANSKNVKWFDNNLVNLFQYGCHEFFTYPT